MNDKEVFNLENVEVSIKLNQKGDMLAQVELRYGCLRIFGYRVMRSSFDDGLYVNPPSIQAGSNWLWLVRIDNPEIWNELQALIKNKYLKEVKKYNTQITGSEENGVLEDDPFE
jgi:hypothetical protein